MFSIQTVFYFDVKKDHFRDSLDRFAQFFIHPLMKQDSVDREIKAVDSGLYLKHGFSALLFSVPQCKVYFCNIFKKIVTSNYCLYFRV